MPGPPKTPTALRLVRGAATGADPSHKPLPKNEPKPEVVGSGRLPRCPMKLSKTEQHWWRYWVETFRSCRVLTRADLVAVCGLAVLTARWQEAREQVSKAGLVFVHKKKVKAGKDDKGNPIYETIAFPMYSPFLSTEQATFTQLQKLIEQFGGTPASRTRVQTAGADAKFDNPFAKFDKRA